MGNTLTKNCPFNLLRDCANNKISKKEGIKLTITRITNLNQPRRDDLMVEQTTDKMP